MDQFNLLLIPIAALIPLVFGYIYYHPKVLGSKLPSSDGESFLIDWSIGKVAILYVLSFLMTYMLLFMSVHQSAVALQLFFMDPELSAAGSEHVAFINDFMATYGDRHRSFGHGMIHGGEAGFALGLAYVGITTLFQGKPFKSVWIHIGYLVLAGALTAGVLCQFI